MEGHTDATTLEERFDHVHRSKLEPTPSAPEGRAKPTARNTMAVTMHEIQSLISLLSFLMTGASPPSGFTCADMLFLCFFVSLFFFFRELFVLFMCLCVCFLRFLE